MYSHKKIGNHKEVWLIWHWRDIFFLTIHERDGIAIHCSSSSESEVVRELLHFTVCSSHIQKQGLVLLFIKSVHASPTLAHIPWDSAATFLIKTWWTGGPRYFIPQKATGQQDLPSDQKTKSTLDRQIMGTKTHQWNTAKEALEDHNSQKTDKSNTQPIIQKMQLGPSYVFT